MVGSQRAVGSPHAPAAAPKDDSFARFVRLSGGRAPIRKVLVANNGIAAVKAIRSIRVWAYETFGNEREVEFVAMATPEDVTANAEYVRMADIWTAVPGGSNNYNFANVDLICDIADRYDCDAVWAGWGHASENPALPRKLLALNIAFMGPPAESMHALGDKIASTIIAQSANVPTVAWSGKGLTVDYKNTGCVPEDIYSRACVESAEKALTVADQCGYPVVIKASEGGGGKGIRVVFDQPALQPAYRQVVGEIPGSPIFVMQLVKNARHLEVQIVADEYGNALALHGRDCSIQRRHQKIIEEGPVVAAPPSVWKKLEQAAVALAKEVGYVGAGTVEYLYTGDETGGEFYFLELNPRLQVEHPVTEWISGINLPALQLHIAMGIPLFNVSCIRRMYNVPDHLLLSPGVLRDSESAVATNGTVAAAGDPKLDTGATSAVNVTRAKPVTFDTQKSAVGAAYRSFDDVGAELLDRDCRPPRGHVIACRITAENPDEGFQPTSGAIQELMFRNTPNVWGYFSVGSSGGVHEFADSQFGHLFAWGENREASRRSLVLALKELSIRGDIRTTVEYLIKLLELPDFRENKIHTAWLDALIAEKVTAERPPIDLAVIIGAVCRAHMDFSETATTFTKCLERGQLPILDRGLVEFPVELIFDDIKYKLVCTRAAESTFRVRLANKKGNDARDGSVVAEVRRLADDGLLVLADGRSHVCYAREEPAGLRLSIDGKTCLSPHEYDPATLAAAVSGKLVRYLVSDGDHVEQEQAYAELEVMKMYLTLKAPESGTISLVKPAGSSLEIGDVLARLELDDPSKVRRSELFTGDLPEFEPPQAIGSKPHQAFNSAVENVKLLLQGYDADSLSLTRFINLIDEPMIAAGELQDALSSLSGRIPSLAWDAVEKAILSIPQYSDEREQAGRDSHVAAPENSDCSSGDGPVESLYCAHDLSAVKSAATAIKKIVQDLPQASNLLAVATKYDKGSVLSSTVCALLDGYLESERPFARSSSSPGDALFSMRDSNRGDLASLVELAASHVQLKVKNERVVDFLQVLSDPLVMRKLGEETPLLVEMRARLHQLSQLFSAPYADIALQARVLLADFNRPQFQQRRSSLEELLTSVEKATLAERAEKIQGIVGLSESILDVLVTFLLPSELTSVSPEIRRIAAEAHLLRSYRAYDVSQFVVVVDESETSTLMATWRFRYSRRDETSGVGSTTTANVAAPPGMVPAATLPKDNAVARGIRSFDSADNLSTAPGGSKSLPDPDPYRFGALATFSSVAEMESNFDSVFERCTTQIDAVPGLDINVMTVLLRWDLSAPSSDDDRRSGNFQDSVAFEEHVSHVLGDFCRANPSRYEQAVRAGIKTVTFIVVPAPSRQSVMYPGFYTYRVREDFKEDPIFRHIDPPMAFQLELARLSNFAITRFGYPNRSIHVFYAQDKAASRVRHPERPPQVVSEENKLEKASLRVSGKNTGDGRATPLTAPGKASEKSGTAAAREGQGKPDPLGDGSTVVPSRNLPPPSPPALSTTALKAHLEDKKVKGDAASNSRVGAQGPGKKSFSARGDGDIDARFFVRAVLRHVEVFSSANDAVVTIPEAERTFVEALDAVEMASCDRRFRRTDCNHIFINVIPTVRIDVEDVQKICRRMFLRYAQRCWLLRVFVVEVKVSTFSSEGTSSAAFLPLRFLLFNPTGHVLRVESYLESTDPATGVVRIVSLSRADQGSLHGTPVSEPYQIMDRMQRNRVIAKTIETVYVYDFIQLFAKQLQSRWRQYSEDRLLGGFRRHKVPSACLQSTELVLRYENGSKESPTLVPADRAPGLNDIGMIAWRITMFTPECPNGRDIIVIANDITFRSGSFGTEEDTLFCAASKLAREEGIPRIYLAANSGARIGVAGEVRERLQVKWTDSNDPLKGIECLTIQKADLQHLKDSVITGREVSPGQVEVLTVVGAADGLGVENLMGSGLIAGESSLAYDEIFTLTYVTARSVGIGAYLVRLGQRVIQKENGAPIILTGCSALNKVLGHEVYVSNDQLGGTKIMHPNGVTHTVVQDDVQGVGAILDWLSYVPAAKGQPLPSMESRDPVSRDVLASPPADGTSYDPRSNLLCGEAAADRREGGFLAGFFDKFSWRETLDGWAKTVVVGRARLGGVPTGVIAVETRSVERVSPADPASPETHESIVMQAGQVWYPDSAAKTAQAIRDFDREGLPLFVFANWRGFSGGMRDMFDEVLKAGSEIVDALRSYKQPVFVYIPPGGELRGGAWVVLDTLINPDQIEMYADKAARGGILEPEGTVDVKYRRRELLKTMHRLDPGLMKLDKQLRDGEALGGLLLTDEEKRTIQDSVYLREAELLPVYKNVATTFCDLHDTPERMLAKGAIRKVLDWKEARVFFYWRLQRRLSENRIRALCVKANPSLVVEQITSLLRRWADADHSLETDSGIDTMDSSSSSSTPLQGSKMTGAESTSVRSSEQSIFDTDDRWVYQWLEVEEDAILSRISKIRVSRIAEDVEALSKESVEGFLEGIENALRCISDDAERSKLASAIQARIDQSASQGAPSNARSLLPPSLLSRLRVGFDPLLR